MTLPDGSRGQLIGCGGIQNDMATCFVKAGQICPNGYDVLNSQEGNGPNSAAAALIGVYGAIDRQLIVRCH